MKIFYFHARALKSPLGEEMDPGGKNTRASPTPPPPPEGYVCRSDDLSKQTNELLSPGGRPLPSAKINNNQGLGGGGGDLTMFASLRGVQVSIWYLGLWFLHWGAGFMV